MRFAMSECFIGSMMGMPPPTLASNAISLPASSAVRMTSSPCVAMSALFAVTTFLPARRAPSTTSRATVVPPMSSMTMSMSGSSRMSWKSCVKMSSTPCSIACSGLREHTRANSTSMP